MSRCYHPELSERDESFFRICTHCYEVVYDPPPLIRQPPYPPNRTIRMISEWYSLRF